LKKPRALMDILLDAEPYIIELMEGHDLEWGDVDALMFRYLETHFPESREEYTDGKHPVRYYGHPDYIKIFKKPKKNKKK
jgi:hypothetical protein